MTVIWYMVPEIWSATDRILCHFGPFFTLLLPPPLTTQKIKILKKWGKKSGDIILYMCTINNNHMMYGSWDMKCDGQNFLPLRTVFCNLTPLTTRKIKYLKNWKEKKKPGDIIILHMRAINDNQMMYGSWDIERNRQNFLSFWTIFCQFTL